MAGSATDTEKLFSSKINQKGKNRITFYDVILPVNVGESKDVKIDGAIIDIRRYFNDFSDAYSAKMPKKFEVRLCATYERRADGYMVYGWQISSVRGLKKDDMLPVQKLKKKDLTILENEADVEEIESVEIIEPQDVSD